MKTYTVVGYYSDTDQPWVEYGSGATVDDAILDALDASDAKETIVIVSVFVGKHVDMLDGDFTKSATEWVEDNEE